MTPGGWNHIEWGDSAPPPDRDVHLTIHLHHTLVSQILHTWVQINQEIS